MVPVSIVVAVGVADITPTMMGVILSMILSGTALGLAIKSLTRRPGSSQPLPEPLAPAPQAAVYPAQDPPSDPEVSRLASRVQELEARLECLLRHSTPVPAHPEPGWSPPGAGPAAAERQAPSPVLAALAAHPSWTSTAEGETVPAVPPSRAASSWRASPVPAAAASRLAEAVRRSLPAPALISALVALADDPECPERELAGRLLDWVTWLEDKGRTLQELTGTALVDKFHLWQSNLDYFLWASPAQALGLLPDDPAAPLGERESELILRRLEDHQQRLRAFLQRSGIERIEAAEGSPLIGGVVEPSSRPPQPTPCRELHGRVCRVEPGEGGYRVSGSVLTPTEATIYDYQP